MGSLGAVAINLNPELVYAEALRRNQRAAGDHFDDGYYVWRLSPGDFTTSVVFPGALLEESGSFAAIKFPDAATTVVQCQRRRPALWLAGRFRVDLDYTSPTAGTANFTMNVQIETLTKAGVVTAPTNLGPGGGLLLPGPAVASTLLQFSAYSTVAMTGDARLVGIRMFRSGAADPNNNQLDIVAVTLTFLPSTREVHV